MITGEVIVAFAARLVAVIFPEIEAEEEKSAPVEAETEVTISPALLNARNPDESIITLGFTVPV